MVSRRGFSGSLEKKLKAGRDNQKKDSRKESGRDERRGAGGSCLSWKKRRFAYSRTNIACKEHPQV